MQYAPIYLDETESKALLDSGSADALFVYLFLRNGNDIHSANELPGFTQQRLTAAINLLQSLNLYKPKHLTAPAKFSYNDQDVLTTMKNDMSFQQLTGEVQHRLGKILSTEDLKILLNIKNYLGLPSDVICVLVSYMVTQAKLKGKLALPSLYQIEKEAYRWADQNIDSLEAALQHMHQKTSENNKLSRMMQILQIRGRTLTEPEKQYADAWLQMNMSDDLLKLAYDKTCVATGGMNWKYMDKIVRSWNEAGYRTVADVKNKWRKGAMPSGPRQLEEAEREAIQRIMSMDIDAFLGN